MSIAVWSDDYLTGNTAVDQQHKTLFAMVNDLHAAVVAGKGKEVLAATLGKLATYTVEHFATEERLMSLAKYPGHPAHKRKHDELAAKAAELIEGYKSGKVVLTITLSQFLADWLRHHINEEDKGLIAWLRQHKA